MITPRAPWVTLALMLLLAACLAGCASSARQPERIGETTSPREGEQVASRSPEHAVHMPNDDVPGNELSGLPRYPGSVRVEFGRARRQGLETIRARYLTRDGLDVVRGYYRSVFRAEGWDVANAEFYEDEWTFLVIHGEREADIELEAHGEEATGMDIEFSEPLPEDEADPDRPTYTRRAEKVIPARASSTPRPQSSSPSPAARTASPAPRSAPLANRPSSPATAPGYGGEFDEDDWDDGGGED